MWFQAGADLVVVVHLLFIGFVVGGVFLAWRWPRIVWAHVPAVVYGALVEFAGFTCPLTLLENDLRRRAGEAGYRGGFIDHYLAKVIYPPGLTRGMQIGLGLLVLLVAIIGYGGYARRHLPVGQVPVRALARSWLSSAGAGSGVRASALGHHMCRPTSRFSAVTSSNRTTMVSSRMPTATAKPSSVENVDGMVARTAKVPASTKPAEVITPPVAASPAMAPWRASRWCASSLTRVIRKML